MRILIGIMLARKRLADHGDERRVERIGRADVASLQDRRAHRLEEPRRDKANAGAALHVGSARRSRQGWSDPVSSSGLSQMPPRIVNGSEADVARALHARQGVQRRRAPGDRTARGARLRSTSARGRIVCSVRTFSLRNPGSIVLDLDQRLNQQADAEPAAPPTRRSRRRPAPIAVARCRGWCRRGRLPSRPSRRPCGTCATPATRQTPARCRA